MESLGVSAVELYYGDPGTSYTYSRREYKPLPWIPELLQLKTNVKEATPELAYSKLNLAKLGFNTALCNLYRNRNDTVGLHAHAESKWVQVGNPG
jgi:alkylated DNA repair dioxygenase AlkB